MATPLHHRFFIFWLRNFDFMKFLGIVLIYIFLSIFTYDFGFFHLEWIPCGIWLLEVLAEPLSSPSTQLMVCDKAFLTYFVSECVLPFATKHGVHRRILFTKYIHFILIVPYVSKCSFLSNNYYNRKHFMKIILKFNSTLLYTVQLCCHKSCWL